MSYQPAEYVAVAGQTDFDVPFPFLSPDHVEVRANGIRHFPLEWVNPTRLRLSLAPGAGSFVTISRNTPIDQQLVKFHDGSVLTQEDLNQAVQQLLFKQQEVIALYEGTLQRARVRIGEANGIPTNAEDIAQTIAEMIAADQVLADFRQRIADIDANALNIADQGITIANHTQEIIEAATSRQTMNTLLADLRADHETLAGVVDALGNLEDGTGIAAVIQQEQEARIAGDTAMAATIGLIGAKSGDNSAFILDLNKVKVSPTESLAQRFSAISTKDGDLATLIQNEVTARTNAVSAEATARTTLAATLRSETAAAITTEKEARVNADQAEATARTNLAATLRGETSALIQQEQTTRANAISAEATARTNLGVAIRGELAAGIAAEQTARINQDNIFVANFTLLGAKNSAGTAWVLDDSRIQLSSGVALATRLSGIDTAIGNNSAAIVNEQNARAQGDQSNASAIQVVNTTVGGLSSSVSTIQQSVNGLFGRWGVQLNVNGHITGVVQNNDGNQGSFDILADKFRIVVPGQTPRTVFTVDSSGVLINGDLRINGNLLVAGSTPTTALPQHAISISAYCQIAYGGSLSGMTANVWMDYDTAYTGGGGSGGGGSGGGGGGGGFQLEQPV